MYRRILVPLMADALQASVHLFRVDAEEGRTRAYLEQVGSDLRAGGHAVHTMAGTGDAAAQILEEGFRQPATLIAMATHGRSGLTRWAVGSVTDKVFRATASPLLIIKPRADDTSAPAALTFRAMIVPLDGSREAETILELVVALRASLKPDTVLVRVVPESGRRGGLDEAAEEGTSEGTSYLEQVRGRLSRPGGPAVTIQVLRGRPADAIAGLARETPDVLIAMTTHGRTGVSRWVLGSVADRVVRTAGVPVLVVLVALGVLQLFAGNFGGLWLMLIGWFIMQAGSAGARQASLREALGGLSVGDVMVTDPVTVQADASVDELIDADVTRYTYGGYPVQRDGKVVGLVTLHDLQKIPRPERAVHERGRVVGLITLNGVMHLAQIRASLDQ